MITKKPKSFLKVNNYIPFSPFFFKGFILIIISFLTLSISAEENYVLLNRAADLFQKEKKEIKNYKVKQEVTSTVKESTGIVVEKRIQTGYFQYPDEYIFVCKEIEMNGIKQILAKPLIERINKSEVDWLSKEGLNSHNFQTLSSDAKIVKYLVTPQKIQAGYFRGQIWIDQETARIVKILKEPIIKKKELMKYSLDLNFESKNVFQAPKSTRLFTIYQINNRTTEISVDVRFEDYQYNLDISKEIPK
ncbi:MAG: hypothetical protein KBA66_08365 [Leptospiraceae bacterium]|nr:hypothetical protein [Leptospiraceae bacterium]